LFVFGDSIKRYNNQNPQNRSGYLLKAFDQRKWLVIVLAAIVVFAILTIANYQFANANPGGNDFLVHWLGTRNFFLTGESPYSDATALKIQTMVYGRAAQAGEHQLRVAYPLYSIFLFAPFALFGDFTLARSLWMSVLELCLFGIAVFSVRLTFWKPKTWLIGLFILFTLFSYHGIRPLINGNAVILITFLMVLALIAIRNNNDEITGILLAVVTIKPQNALLFIGFILLWAIVNKRSRIITWFLGAMVIFVGFSILLIPDWMVQNLREIVRYPSYNPDGTVGAVLKTAWGAIGERVSIGLSFVLLVALLAEWWLSRHATTRRFLWTAFLTLAISQWIGIQTDPGNFILLYPGVFYCFYLIADRWGARSNLFLVVSLAVVAVGIWVIFLTTLVQSYQPIQSSAMFFPMPLIAFGLLYWVRWWVNEAGILELNKKSLGI
jgi:hypothetical protein